MKRILITGAAGHIGRALRAGMRGHYMLRLADIAEQAPAGSGEEIVQADIRDPAAMVEAMRDVDCVVHLAGIPDEDAWPRIREMNIDGCYNVFEAAYRMGVKRVVFASSNHAVGFHRRDQVLDGLSLPRPDSRYGVSKAFGEALGRLYADKHGVSVACLRIGSFRPDDTPTAPRHLATWISHRDMVQLTRRCIDHPNYHYVVVYGVSGNDAGRWDNGHAAFLGYQPQDNANAWSAQIRSKASDEDAREALFHGGFGCMVEFDGDLRRIA
ncbi:NAD-dependent epimerase/dehydratase family protein [Bordetella flabilis]|uniref:Epimerase n=1 Tax=Bordetella flabilis TaxID=463014 RepID=A0A193GD68_9BORD|nr:NAD(P)-dependent oxidoreductase [Bordetella flabilis]ANN77972.1 epimerase [Bordetella flabilis]